MLHKLTGASRWRSLAISVSGPRLEYVETGAYMIKFGANHISFSERRQHDDSYHFDVEEKLYANSNHSGKISFACWSEENTKKVQETIMEFIANLMDEEKPIPRFKLSDMVRSKQKK